MIELAEDTLNPEALLESIDDGVYAVNADKNFWSVTAYHPDTRSLLQNGMPKPSISSYDKPDMNEDGTTTIWFAQEAPK